MIHSRRVFYRDILKNNFTIITVAYRDDDGGWAASVRVGFAQIPTAYIAEFLSERR